MSPKFWMTYTSLCSGKISNNSWETCIEGNIEGRMVLMVTMRWPGLARRGVHYSTVGSRLSGEKLLRRRDAVTMWPWRAAGTRWPPRLHSCTDRLDWTRGLSIYHIHSTSHQHQHHQQQRQHQASAASAADFPFPTLKILIHKLPSYTCTSLYSI